MGEKTLFYSAIAVFFFLACAESFAQEVLFTPRENLILFTLSQLQERDQAFDDSMKQAESKLKRKKIREIGATPAFSFEKLIPTPHPYLTASAQYNDNVDSTDAAKKTQINYNFTPGLKATFIRRKSNVNVDLHVDTINYSNRTINNAVDADTSILGNFNLGNYLLTLSDDFFTNYLASQEFGIKKDTFAYYWQNVVSSTLSRNFNRIGFDLGYTNSYFDYRNKQNTHTDETFSFHQFLRIATKTQLLMDYSHVRSKYNFVTNSSSDYNANNYTLGLTGSLTSKLTGMGQVIYYKRDAKAEQSYRDTTLSTDLGYTISERANMTFGFSHLTHEPSVKSNYYRENIFSFSGNDRLAINPKFNLSYSLIADYVDYTKLETEPNPKKNATYTLGLGLSYAFRDWLDFSLTWQHIKKKSNVEIDYNDNIVLFKSQARF